MITIGRKTITVSVLRSGRTGKLLPPVVRLGRAPLGVPDAVAYGLHFLPAWVELSQ